MLTRSGYGRDQSIVVHCDSCGEQLDTGLPKLADAVVGARSLGWIIEKVNGVWLHLCKSCEKGETK